MQGSPAVERLLNEMRTEVGRADTKASVLTATMGMGIAVLLSVGRPDTADGRTGLGAWTDLWWSGCVAWAAGLGCLMAAVAPRYRRSAWTSEAVVSYFGDIRRAAKAGELSEALRRTEMDSQASLLNALAELSRIVLAKYRWIRASLACFGLGLLLLILEVLPL